MTDIFPSDVENRNLSKNNNFRFQIKRTPHLNYFLQSVDTPGLSQTPVTQATTRNPIFLGGDKVDYSELTLTFKVDENFENYKEIHNWIRGIAHPLDSKEYKDFIARNDAFSVNPKEHKIYSDGTLFILTNALNVNLMFTFIDLQPVSLSGVRFTTQDTSELDATVTFRYSHFEIDSTKG